MPVLYELKAQLADRADRLRRLMTFVVQNGLLERVRNVHTYPYLAVTDSPPGATVVQKATATQCREGAGCHRALGSPG